MISEPSGGAKVGLAMLIPVSIFRGSGSPVVFATQVSRWVSVPAVNMTVGWLGMISLVLAPAFTLINVYHYLASLGLESPRPGATAPQLDDAFFARVNPHMDYLVERLNQGEDFSRVTEDVAMRAGVSPGQVALLIHAMAAQQQQA